MVALQKLLKWFAPEKEGRGPQPMALVWAAIAVGVLLLLFDGIRCAPAPETDVVVTAETETRAIGPEVWQIQVSSQVEQVLSKITGAGKVSVVIQLETGLVSRPVRDEDKRTTVTDERDGSGGERTVTEIHATTRVVNSSGDPLWETTEMPPVVSAVIVAEGAWNANVRLQLHRAAVTLLGLPAHRVIVLPGGDDNGN